MQQNYQIRLSECDYYKNVLDTINKLSELSVCKTVIDVGCGDCSLILDCHIPHKTMFDYWTTPKYEGCNNIHGNIVDYDFADKKYDIVCCLQTLEHIPEIGKAITNLFSISSKFVIITLPYCWPKGKELEHVHDPIDDDKISDWFSKVKNFRQIYRRFCDNGNRILIAFERLKQEERL